MKFGQCYKIKLNRPKRSKPGQMVFYDNDSTVVRGFIQNVENGIASIYLFEPGELPDTADVIHESVDKSFWMEQLNKICKEDMEIGIKWAMLAYPDPN